MSLLVGMATMDVALLGWSVGCVRFFTGAWPWKSAHRRSSDRH